MLKERMLAEERKRAAEEAARREEERLAREAAEAVERHAIRIVVGGAGIDVDQALDRTRSISARIAAGAKAASDAAVMRATCMMLRSCSRRSERPSWP